MASGRTPLTCFVSTRANHTRTKLAIEQAARYLSPATREGQKSSIGSTCMLCKTQQMWMHAAARCFCICCSLSQTDVRAVRVRRSGVECLHLAVERARWRICCRKGHRHGGHHTRACHRVVELRPRCQHAGQSNPSIVCSESPARVVLCCSRSSSDLASSWALHNCWAVWCSVRYA